MGYLLTATLAIDIIAIGLLGTGNTGNVKIHLRIAYAMAMRITFPQLLMKWSEVDRLGKRLTKDLTTCGNVISKLPS